MQVSLTYIIGYPGEGEDSRLRTLDQAREIVSDVPSAAALVYPYRPIPGSALYEAAVRDGYTPPADLEAWGGLAQYHERLAWEGRSPPRVERVWRRYWQYASFFHGLVRDEPGWMERIAAWRLRSGVYAFPLELRVFHALERLLGRTDDPAVERRRWHEAGERAPATAG